MIKGVIFDMDGTIVDSLPYHYKAWEKFFEENKVENFSERLKDYKGGGTIDLLITVLGNDYSKKELESMVDDKEIIFRSIYKNNVIPIKGFIQMLESIKSQKILVGLASNAIRKNVKMILNELKIYNEFESIICGDEVKKGKPDPEMFNETARIFKLDKKDCLIFEDSIEGLQGAVNSGIDAIGVRSSSSDKILISAGAKGTIKNYLDIDLKLKKIGLSF
ncbi:MAG: HAD family hydrolase [Candidatus Marisimplicoccus sp.]